MVINNYVIEPLSPDQHQMKKNAHVGLEYSKMNIVFPSD